MSPDFGAPSLEDKEEDDQVHIKLINFPSNQTTYNSLSWATTCFSSSQDQNGNRLESSCDLLQHDHDPKVEKSIIIGGSNDSQVLSSSSLVQHVVNDSSNEVQKAVSNLSRSRSDQLRTIDRDEDQISKRNINGSVKWMSSKVRLMKKMMKNSINHRQQDHHKPAAARQSNNIIRICSDCSTTSTPLWRSGPQGPKSLCNACGIRQRKVRRAMAEAAAVAATNGGLVVAFGSTAGPSTSSLVKHQNKEKKSRTSAHKNTNRNLTEDDRPGSCNSSTETTLSLNNFRAFGRPVFPQDEEEAAILLMELSCGLVHT